MSSTWEFISRWPYILKNKIILGFYAGEYEENLRINTLKKNGIKKAQNNQKKAKIERQLGRCYLNFDTILILKPGNTAVSL